MHVYHQYTVRIAGSRRDAVAAGLAERGVGTMVYYPTPVHRLPVYDQPAGCCPMAEAAAAEVLSLPMGPFLTRATQDRVLEVLFSS